MPKKQLNSQLEKLFSHFGNKEQPQPPQQGQSLPAWTCEWDTDGKYQTCSPEVETSLGIQAGRFIGQPATFGISPQSAPLVQALLKNPQHSAQVDVYYLSSEGAHVPVRLHLQPRTTKNAQPSGWQVTASVLPSESSIAQLPTTDA